MSRIGAGRARVRGWRVLRRASIRGLMGGLVVKWLMKRIRTKVKAVRRVGRPPCRAEYPGNSRSGV